MNKRFFHAPVLALSLVGASLASACGLAAPALPGAHASELTASARTAAPAWLEGAVVYAMVPPLYGENPFKDAAAKLDELKALGAAGTFTLQLPTKLQQGMTLKDALTGAEVTVKPGQTTLALPLPQAGAVVLVSAGK